jgi:type I restriction enzyme, S subunit
VRAGWEVRPLGEVCEVRRGTTITQKTTLPGEVPVIAGGISPAYFHTVANRPANTITVSGSGAGAGFVNFFDVPIFASDCSTVLPKDVSHIDVRYAYKYLKFKEPYIQAELRQGAAQPHVYARDLERLPITFPPLEEQRRIVAILEEAFEGLARARTHAEANLQNARELFGNFLGAVFSDSERGWKTAKLDQLVEADCTLSYGIVQPGDDVRDGLPIVRPTDLGERIITPDGLKRINPENARGYARTQLKGSEILLCVRGSTGVVSMASEGLMGANVTRGIVPIRFDPSKINQQLGYYQFLSKPIQDQIKAGTYGAALMQINIRDLRMINFAAPPLAEQEALLAQLDSVASDFDQLVVNYGDKVAEIDALRQSLLQRAFAGELT